MTIPTERGAGFRTRLPAVLVRGADSPTRLQAYLNNAAQTVSSATYTLRGETGEPLVDAAVVSGEPWASGVVVHTVPASALPATLPYGQRYREEWRVVISGTTHTVTRGAAVVRTPLTCPVTPLDLLAENPSLQARLRNSTTTLQGYIDQAWEDVVVRLLRVNTFPEAIVDVETMIEPLRELAMSKYWRWAASEGGEQGSMAMQLARDAQAAYERSFASVSYRVDADQDGVIDSETRHSAVRLTRNMGPPYRYPSPTGRRVY